MHTPHLTQAAKKEKPGFFGRLFGGENKYQIAERKHNQVDKLLSEGRNFAERGNSQRAIKAFAKVLRISDELDDSFGRGSALGSLGIVYNQIGNPRLAVDYLDKALGICRASGNRREVGTNLVNLGSAYQNLGDVQRAIGYYEEALDVDREIGNQREVAADLCRLGWAYSTIDNMHHAIKYFEEAMTIYRKVEDAYGIVSCSAGLGSCFAAEDDLARALPLAEEAIRLGEAINHPLTQQAKQLLVELQTARKEVESSVNQILQAFMNVNSPKEMQALVRQYPFMANDEFVQVLTEVKVPPYATLAFNEHFGWLKQIVVYGKVLDENDDE